MHRDSDLRVGMSAAPGCMLEKQTLRKILDFCDGPYDFMLIENIPVEHRSRARKNGWQNVKGLL